MVSLGNSVRLSFFIDAFFMLFRRKMLEMENMWLCGTRLCVALWRYIVISYNVDFNEVKRKFEFYAWKMI